jgi:rubrerythrin
MDDAKKYLDYFQQLYSIERDMEKEADVLLEMIPDPRIRKLLLKLRSDEQRHAKIVEAMMALVS